MRKVILPLFFAILLALLVWAAPDATVSTPADKSVDLDGNLTFTGSVAAGSGRNVSNVSLWTNITGTWQVNSTNTSFVALAAEGQGFFDVQFLGIINLTDGEDLLWGIEIKTNATDNIHNSTFTENRTVYVEFPPTVSTNYPVDSQNISDSVFNVTVVPSSVWIDNNLNFTCDVFTNNTNNDLVLLGRFDIPNGSSINNSVGGSENVSRVIAAKCWEVQDDNVFAWASNISVTLDRTAPTVSVSQNFSNDAASTSNVEINYTITDADPYVLHVFVNTTGNNWELNQTTKELSNGQNVKNAIGPLPDGDYVVGGWISDFSGHNATIDNYTFTVDTVAPLVKNVANLSGMNALLTVQINWTTDEEANGSVSWGTTQAQHTNNTVETDSQVTGHAVNITLVEGQTYYYNITSCDLAGNCNASNQEFQIDTASAIYAGWNAFGIFNTISMGQIYNDSGADYVYWWNNTGQSWVSHIGGSGSNANLDINGGDVVWLFKSFDGTWLRDVNDPAENWEVNLTNGVNFLSAQQVYNFSDLSNSFTNNTVRPAGTNAIPLGSSIGGATDGTGGQGVDISEVEFYAMYNNSEQRYVNFFRNETFNNDTIVGKGFAIFIGTPLNITYNGTAVKSNWTVT